MPGKILLDYRITGPLQKLKIPQYAENWNEQLWKSTCLEFFIHLPHSENYIEWNFSPNGKTVGMFLFESYRKRETETSSLKSFVECLEHSCTENTHETKLLIHTDFSSTLLWQTHQAEQIQSRLHVILEDIQGTQSFWALKHLGSKPDFHLKAE